MFNRNQDVRNFITGAMGYLAGAAAGFLLVFVSARLGVVRWLSGLVDENQILIQALPKTADIPVEQVRVLDAYRAARNQNDYRGVPVSDSVAEECAADARRLLGQVRNQ